MALTDLIKTIHYESDLSTPMSRDVFSVIKVLNKDERSDYKDLLDEEVSLAESGEEGKENLDAYLISVHAKKLLTVDYQLLVEATGKANPNEVDSVLSDYGIGDETLLVVLTFIRSDSIDKYKLPE